MRRVVWIGVCPDLRIIWVVPWIGRRVRPVVRFRGDGGGQGEICTWICAGGAQRTSARDKEGLPGFEPGVGVPDFDPAVAVLELTALDARECALGVEGEQPPRWTVLKYEVVVPKGHLWQRDPECGLEGVALWRVGDGVGRGGDAPVVDVD